MLRGAVPDCPLPAVPESRRRIARSRPAPRRIAARLSGFLTMVGVAAFAVSVSVPAAAFYVQEEQAVVASAQGEALQSLEAESTVEVAPIARDAYTVT